MTEAQNYAVLFIDVFFFFFFFFFVLFCFFICFQSSVKPKVTEMIFYNFMGKYNDQLIDVFKFIGVFITCIDVL